MESKLRSNIWKYYAIGFFRFFLICMPVIVPFYQSNGLTLTEVFLLQGAFSATIVLSEIPSGYWADVVGRKKSVVIGTVLFTAGFWIYSFSHGFYGFLVAEIIMGAGAAFVSGADSALVYESLVALNETERYKSIEGKRIAVESFSETDASILGGFVAVYSLRLPFVLEAAVTTFSIFLAISLHEPPREKSAVNGSHVKQLIDIMKFSLHENKKVKWLIIYGSIMGVSTLVLVWLYQPYFKLVGLPIEWFGIAWAGVNLSTGLFSHSAAAIEKKVGGNLSLILLPIIFVAATTILGSFVSVYALGAILLAQFIRGFSRPVLLDYVNRLVESDRRATVLSIKNLIGRLIFVVLSPFIGLICDVLTLPVAIIVWGVIILVSASIAAVCLKKVQAVEEGTSGPVAAKSA